WKASPGHYRNITQASANTLGIGVAADSSGRLYFTQNFATNPAGSVSSAPVSSAPATTPAPAPVASTPSTRTTADFFAWARTFGSR
ncbi:CAP domain-containing protein, partial [Mycetocola sp.]|uniref:CAP domain-containing protein n=1 Tax=Mycetocola sp. TaxID=1871042 RepID=UPI002623187D